WYGQRLPETPLASVRIEAEPMPPEQAENEREYRVVTSRIDGSISSLGSFPVTPASISFSVLASNQVLFSGESTTDKDGVGRISIPPELAIPSDAMLKVTASDRSGNMSNSSIEVPLEPTRCLTFLTVDRPVYRPGETVYFRSLTLQRRSLVANADVPIRFELTDPSGAVVPGAFTEGVTDRGVGNGVFMIPSAAAGGTYRLVAKSLDEFFPEEHCEFQVRAYRVPRFKKELEFRKRSYGPGETVQADFSAIRAEGGPLADASLRITATVDGKVVHQSTATTSSSGNSLIEFALPPLIREGKGQLSVIVDDRATRETKSKTIPIQVGRVSVDFYPEAGYLVDGLTNRVYFVARDTLGNPIDLAGEILDRSGQYVAKVETARDGMGRFEMVPRRGERYTLKVNRPVDVTNSPKLPAVVKDLPVIDTGIGVFASDEDITLSVRTTKELSTIVRAVCRGELIGEIVANLRPGENPLRIPVRSDAGGVVRVTVFDGSTLPARPLAERLIYRRQDKELQVEIVDRDSALERSPGEPLRLTFQVRDETGEPTPAVLGVSVVDDAALSLDDTERPQLRTHFLLTSEVEKPEDLEHANFYLSDDDGAEQSLDLLLGTQGWRRFVSGDPAQSNVAFREQLIRLLELDGKSSQATAAQRFDSSLQLAEQWERYRGTAQLAWERFVSEARTLLLLVLGCWLLLIAFHMRRHARLNVATWLLVTSTSLWIYGCGASPEAMVVSVDSSAEPAEMDEAYDQEMEAAMDAGAEMEEFAMPAARSTPMPEPNAVATDSTRPLADANALAVGNSMRSESDEEIWYGEPGGKLQDAKDVYRKNVSRLIPEDDLKRLLAARGLDAEMLADQLLDELRFPVRQYAHQHVPSEDGLREDFSETLCWQPLVITDSEGRATVRFDLSDSVTTFRVNVDGHAANGRIGSTAEEIRSRLPFQIEPKMPLEVTTGDKIRLPVAVINSTNAAAEVVLQLESDSALQSSGSDRSRSVSLNPNARTREYFSLNVVSGLAESDAKVELRGSTATLSDSIRRHVHISPKGYPLRRSIAGRVNESTAIQMPIPGDMIDGSLAVTVRAYPSPIADVMSGVESILREPHGCFEQTSATNYPNAMALRYLEQTKTSNPEVSRKAIGMLDRGYQKLVSFECDKLGYEWFGSDPGHEALSAFGLMQFTDMSQVMQVSQEMMTRTRQWLLARRDGSGGFQRNPRHLHVWSVEQAIVNAYVLWAITEADVAAGQPMRGTSEFADELEELNRVAQESDDPYLVALSAATLMNVRRTDDGLRLLDKLASAQEDDGHLEGRTTVTSSGGLSRKMETTAIAALAWVKSPRHVSRAQQAAGWLTSHRQGTAGFGSTQATVLALKALIAVASESSSTMGGTLQVKLDGEIIGHAKLPDDPRSGTSVEIEGLGAEIEELLRDRVEIELELVAVGSNDLAYTVDIACHVETPESDEACPLRLTTELASDRVAGPVTDGQLLTVHA
ncbi:MAG: MG2 domain-containing protein, partial [Rubripirellula sp.]